MEILEQLAVKRLLLNQTLYTAKAIRRVEADYQDNLAPKDRCHHSLCSSDQQCR